MQVHIHKYISEESAHLCFKKGDAPSSKVIIFLLHAHCQRKKHCSAAIAKHHRCSGAAVTVTERPTQTQSTIFTSSPQN